LDTRTAWLLCNLKNRSTLIGYGPNHVPTESYLQDSAQLTLHGAGTNTGLWLSLESTKGEFDLPPNQAQPYTWKVGRGAGGLSTPWYLEVDSANPGLGVQIFATSNIKINGTGLPATGELKVALVFANNTDSMTGLKVGLQHTTVANGPAGSVTLSDVNLGPIAWQLYALANENLFVKNSVVNEIGIGGPSKVTVDSAVLQFGALAAIGIGGSSMTINNSDIWNQAITAGNNSVVTINNCKITGSAFNTTDSESRITVNRGCFLQNPSGCTGSAMVDAATGVPLCNPFIPAGYPQNLSPATVTFNGANYGCTPTTNDNSVKIFPNPSINVLEIEVPNVGEPYSIEFYSIIGQRLFGLSNQKSVDISTLANGIYIIEVRQEGKTWVNKIVKM
jgi:Secretion system C-terminal sorting domain